MARTKDLQKSINTFKDELTAIERFINIANGHLHLGPKQSSKKFNEDERDWCYDLAIIKLFVAFETLMLECLVYSMNKSPKSVTAITGIDFKTLTVPVCEYLIYGKGFFDFKGKSGLVQTLLRFLPKNHWLISTVKKDPFDEPLERLSALRNFAAHDSESARSRALTAIGGKKLKGAGSWLRVNQRLPELLNKFRELADEISVEASKPKNL